MRSRSASLPVGTLQGDAIRNITGSMTGASNATGFKSLSGVLSGADSGTTDAGTKSTQAYHTVNIDISTQVPTADENRPKSAVVMYCIKVLDSVYDPEQVLAQAAISDMAHRNEIKELAGTRLWVSGEYQPVLNTPTIVTHGLNIDPMRCRCDVLLKCVVSQGGYNIGDYAIGWSGLNISGYHLSHPPVPSLTSTTIQFNTGAYSTGLVVYNKTNGGSLADFKVANWRYIFRIWY